MSVFLINLYEKITSSDLVNRAAHTFLQAFLAALLVSYSSVHDLSSAQSVLLAAVAAGISALKTLLVNFIASRGA